MWIKRNLVMLPTNTKANQFDCCKKEELYLKSTKTGNKLSIAKEDLDSDDMDNIRYFNSNCNITFQHLYITSNEEIIKGDWGIKTYGMPSTEEIVKYSYNMGNTVKKIIATTDESLNNEILKENPPFSGPYNFNLIPQPSEAFIQKFVEEYNKGNLIIEVMVEYENVNSGWQFLANNDKIGSTVVPNDFQLKVNPKDNTIAIRKVKDSWSRNELIEVLHTYREFIWKYGASVQDCDKWIEKNL